MKVGDRAMKIEVSGTNRGEKARCGTNIVKVYGTFKKLVFYNSVPYIMTMLIRTYLLSLPFDSGKNGLILDMKES